MFTQPIINEGSFHGFLDYYFRTSGGNGYPTNAFNDNLDIAKVVIGSTSWASWNSTTKRLLINESGKYRIKISYRANIRMNIWVPGSAKYDLEIWVKNTIKARTFSTHTAGNITGMKLIAPYYNQESAPPTPTTPYSFVSGGGAGGGLVADGNYIYCEDFHLNVGDEVYMKSYNVVASYSSPVRTTPEGTARIQDLHFVIEKIT